MSLITIISAFYIGLCTYINACVADIATFIPKINGIAIHELKSMEQEEQLNGLLNDMIRFHIAILK